MVVCISKLKKLNHSGETAGNVSLDKYTTYRVGGRAKVLLKVCTLECFIKVMNYITEKHIPYFVLGAGSNVLVSSRGYDGVVITLGGDLSRQSEIDGGIECSAGVKLYSAFAYARNLSLGGLEVLSTIPGTVGGAVYMNAGAYGVEMSNIVKYVVAFVDGKIRYYTPNECEFAYRSSVFQRNGAIILRVGLELKTQDKEEIQRLYTETMLKKRTSQPLEFPSAGSVFKKIEGHNVSQMLDALDVKGWRVGGAEVSTKHANFIINKGSATPEDIYTLIKKIKSAFEEKYSLVINTEIKFLGEFYETNG